jgi:hypothetical protein
MIDKAIVDGQSEGEMFTSDGEGYLLKITCLGGWNDDRWKEHEPDYTCRIEMNKEQVATIKKFLKVVKNQIEKDKEILKKNGFVIDNLEDRWQKLAFTLYTDIAALSIEAEQILDYMEEDET